MDDKDGQWRLGYGPIYGLDVLMTRILAWIGCRDENCMVKGRWCHVIWKYLNLGKCDEHFAHRCRVSMHSTVSKQLRYDSGQGGGDGPLHGRTPSQYDFPLSHSGHLVQVSHLVGTLSTNFIHTPHFVDSSSFDLLWFSLGIFLGLLNICFRIICDFGGQS